MANIERPYTGLTAEIKINDVILGYMSGIDLTIEKTIIEILQFGAQYQEKVPAIKDWSATVDGTVALAPGGSQQKLYDAFENSEELTVGIFLDEFVYFEGKAYVANFNITGAPDDKMNLSCDLAGNGAIILTLPPTYNITTNSGVGGTVTPGGTHRVTANGSFTLTIAPAPNYSIDAVYDNGDNVTASVTGNIYNLTDITQDHTIQVTFKTAGGADKTNLRAAISYVNTLVEADYTTATWSNVELAATAASQVNGNVAATQTEVDNATTALNDAIIALEKA